MNATDGEAVDVGGFKFAPVNVPMKRRYETLGLMFWTWLLFVCPFMCVYIFYYVLVYTQFWWTMPLYCAWVYYDWNSPKTGGYPNQSMRGWRFFQYFLDYFPIKLVKTVDIKPDQNYIFGVFPHGIMSYGVLGNFGCSPFSFDTLFPGLKSHPMTLQMNFYVPFRREYMLMLGFVDVSRESIRHLLRLPDKGHCAVIVVGGAEEALDAHPGMYNLTLKRRKGFVREAILAGAQLVPVFTFGENDLYVQMPNKRGSSLRNWQTKMKKWLGFSAPMAHGRGIFNYSFGFNPFRTPITTVVGAPIPTKQQDIPDHDYVNQVHQQFMDELSSLFEEHKLKYGVDEDAHLQFF